MMNPAVEKAIQGKLGGSPEPGSEELLSLDVLTVSYAHGIEGLGVCKNLDILILSACELPSLSELQNLRSLRTLLVNDTALADVEGLAGLDVLAVHIERSSLDDISPLLSCPRLLDVKLSGTPLDEESYREVIPELIRRDCRISAPSEREWKLMRAMRELGLPYSYYSSAKGHRLCRPGLRLTQSPRVNHPLIAPDALESVLASDPARLEELFIRE